MRPNSPDIHLRAGETRGDEAKIVQILRREAAKVRVVDAVAVSVEAPREGPRVRGVEAEGPQDVLEVGRRDDASAEASSRRPTSSTSWGPSASTPRTRGPSRGASTDTATASTTRTFAASRRKIWTIFASSPRVSPARR